MDAVEIIKLIASTYGITLEATLWYIDHIDIADTSRRLKLINKAQRLRESAKSIRQSAQHADRNDDMRSEIKAADELDLESDKLESLAA